MNERISLNLSREPDEFGFYYGTASLGDTFCRVNVMPPVASWTGGQKLAGYEPDPECWVVYADGEEIARVKRREDLAAVLQIKWSKRTTEEQADE